MNGTIVPRQSKQVATPKQSFNAASRIIGPVGKFGEHLIACLLSGKVVSTEEEFQLFSDVHVERMNLAAQVKMCNQRHATRPTVDQVTRFERELTTPAFLLDIDYGLYAMVFYGGVKTKDGKSKILSRKLGSVGRRAVLAQELQVIYLIDVLLMNHFATSENFMKLRRSGLTRVWDKFKAAAHSSRQVLYLNRTFLRGFMEKPLDKLYRSALTAVYGKNGSLVVEDFVGIRFTREMGGGIIAGLPIRIIGSVDFVDTVRRSLGKKKDFVMSLED